MASKSVHQFYDAGAMSYYGLAGDPFYGVIAGSNVENVLVTQDKTTYENIQDTLESSKETDSTFKNKKKAFVLPGADVSLDKIKAALKEHKITVTNDYTLADLIVTHDNISKRCENGENIPSSKMLVKLWNYETTSGDPNSLSSIQSLIASQNRDVIVTNKITDSIRYYSLNIEDSLYDGWIITGLALNIAHLIDTGEVTTVDIETVLHASANKMQLTEELMQQIKSMVHAGGDDKAMAATIIPNIDYESNHHFLWKLAQDCNAITYDFNRNKDIQFWLDKSNFGEFYHKNAQDMILWLEENSLLSKESFRYLEPICRKEISIHNRDLYVFQVSVKKEYKKYLV
jgi:hypothetical protein